MSTADLPGRMKPLGDTLRELPQVAPDRSAWPELAARLAAEGIASAPPPRRRAWLLPAALAAGVALAAIAWPLLHAPAPAPTVATVARPAASTNASPTDGANATSGQGTQGGDPAARLASLQRRSQDLEHWLRETGRVAAPLSGQDLAAAAEIEDMIALVDGQLDAAPADVAPALWRRRVALLEDLTVLRYSSYTRAETGVALR